MRQNEKAVSGERFGGHRGFSDFSSQILLSWIRPICRRMLHFEWRMQPAFEHLGNLIDGFFKEGFFEEVLQGISGSDPEGPRLDIPDTLSPS